MKLLRGTFLGGLILMLATPALLPAQVAGFDGGAKPKPHIAFVSHSQVVPAGKSALLLLQFVVQEGFHVNSHTPKSELLIPTQLTLEPAEGVKAAALEYPAGTEYSFSFDPSEEIDVYSGPFTVKLPVIAAPGEHRVTGTLRYQACDHAACYPPKTLPVEVLFSAK